MVRRSSGLDALEILGRALEAECSWGLAILADGRAAVGAGSLGLRLGGGRVPLRGSSVSHWLPAVSLGTWRRWRLRPFSGWAEGGGESHRTEWRGSRRATRPVSVKCWRAAGPGGTGKVAETATWGLLVPRGHCWPSRTPKEASAGPQEQERTDLEWEPGEWVGAVAVSWRSGLVGTVGSKPETQPTNSF